MKSLIRLVAGFFFGALFALPRVSMAEYQFKNFPAWSAATEYRMETILGEQPNDVISQRNELKIELRYDGHTANNKGDVRVDFYAQLRPFYDSVYDMNIGGMSENDSLRERWRTNFTEEGNRRDPLLRELYFDLSGGDFRARVGRQIVSWGKSDGVFMLDVVNPFNLRNPFKFEEEDTKIPLWMLNFEKRIGTDSTIQFLWSPFYQRAESPGYRVQDTEGGLTNLLSGGASGAESRNHAFGFGVLDFVNEFYQFEDFARSGFTSNGVSGNFPIRYDDPDNVIKDSVVGLRWGGVAGNLNYTLNYLYTWSIAEGDFSNTGNFIDGTVSSVIRKPKRMHVVGASWDYPLNNLPGPFRGTVWRGETAFFLGDLLVNADPTSIKNLSPEKVNRHGLMMGFDQNFTLDLFPSISRAYIDPIWFLSIQYWQDYVIDADHSKNPFYDSGAGTPSWAAFGTPAYQEKGQRDAFKSQITVSLSKDLLPFDVLHTEWFVLYGIQAKDAWFRGKLRYEVTDDLNVAVGYNKFLGGKFDPIGQFKDSDHVFLELRYSLF